jgi:acetolactate decarboxylase
MILRPLLLFLVCSSLSTWGQSTVRVFGQLRKIMHQGDLSAAVSLDTLRLSSTTFGLGVAEGLKGEIIILAGKTYRSFVEGDRIITKEESDTRAGMLVFADLRGSRESFEATEIRSIEDLERSLKDISAKNGLTGPFPFIIKTGKAIVGYHIIDWQDGIPHTPSSHKRFAKMGIYDNEEVVIVGFYSDQHQGIFTPHASPVHMHVFNATKNIVGHVDSISFTETVEISIPLP